MRNRPSIRTRLAGLLDAAFKAEGLTVSVQESDIRPAQGYWRQKRADVYSWEGTVVAKEIPFHVTLCAWPTMTECVRKGIKLNREKYGAYEVELL